MLGKVTKTVKCVYKTYVNRSVSCSANYPTAHKKLIQDGTTKYFLNHT